MATLKSKKILVGICGGIAAYKVLSLIRLLKKSGAEVKVIMTPAAVDFVGVLTPATLSESEILTEFYHKQSGRWTNHVELGLWADLFVVAPATASTLSKMANGLADNLLIATYLSAKCPVWAAPAMDLDMWKHISVQQTIEKLKNASVRILEPNSGPLASGLEGQGRMQEPEELFASIEKHFAPEKRPLFGKQILLTMGPTVEAIDPVRFISNHSTGKMGAAIAWQLHELGAKLTIVSGPISASISLPEVELIRVTSAKEMGEAALAQFPNCDLAVLAAAVADYTPKIVSTEKIKKKSDNLSLELVKTMDIAAELGKSKTSRQQVIGFALETENAEVHALEKLRKKNLDAIILNSMRDEGAGFGFDTNQISILHKSEPARHFEKKLKTEVAKDIANYVVELLEKN